MQKRAIRMVTNWIGRTYEDRLIEAEMTSLVDRRTKGDMIPTYKILTGKDKVVPGMLFGLPGDGLRTRLAAGVHPIRLQAVRPKLDIRRNTFSQRVVSTWNSLPDRLKEVLTVDGFKAGYDAWVSGGRVGA